MKLTNEQVERIKSLEDESGRITPALVVEDARQKSSPLHSLFEWNVKKAAETQWLHQAREIIGAVRLVITTTTATFKTTHYAKDTDADGQGYRAVLSIKRDPEQARETLIYTLEVAHGHLQRAFDLAAALGLETEIDALLERVAGVQRQIKEAA